MRYGDRNTLTGLHHQPVDAAQAVHGIDIGQPVHTNPNGTYRAPVWFLDPVASPGSRLAEFDSRWHRRADAPDNMFYPGAGTRCGSSTPSAPPTAARPTGAP